MEKKLFLDSNARDAAIFEFPSNMTAHFAFLTVHENDLVASFNGSFEFELFPFFMIAFI